PDQRLHGVAVALMPESRERAALELARIGGTDMRPRQAEIELVALVQLEDEGVGEGTADAGGVDVAALRRAARSSQPIPIVKERPGARLLHSPTLSMPQQAPWIRFAAARAKVADGSEKIALNHSVRLMRRPQCG